MVKKITVNIAPVFKEHPMFEHEQLRRSLLIATHLLAIRGRQDLSQLLVEAPWFVPALETFDAHLVRHGFEDGLSAVGEANRQAHRVAVQIRDFHSWGEHFCNTAISLCWYRRGASGREWFFHAVFDVEPEYGRPPHNVLFFNALDPNGAHFTPACLEQPAA